MTTLSDADLDAIMGDMRAAALQEILPRFLALTGDAIRTKTGPDDLVTDADIGVERMLSEALLTRFPGAVVVGEEAVSADPTLLDRLKTAELAVIIDPVDGTWNFAHGLPLFGTMVAVVSGGEVVAGLIHYPLTADFLIARKGGGAWHVASNGARRPMRVAEAGAVADMLGLLALPLPPATGRADFAARATAFARTQTFRCSAYEYRLIIQGSLIFSINAGLMPWDHAAGWLIHQEAGGYSALLTGEPYHPAMTEGQLLLAPDAQSWRAIRDVMVE